VFLDPPYDLGLVKKTLKTLMAYDIVNPVSFLIVQHSHSESLPDLQEKFSLLKHRKYGKTFLAIFQRNPG
jgi:16S rRNA (guanine966-N2)-methyltransferase